MNRLCICIADSTRARLFTFDEMRAPPGHQSQELLERTDLVHPARRRRPSELFSDSRPGSDRTPTGRVFGRDDHREGALRHMDRQFARDIVDELERLIAEHDCHAAVLAASPRMLGILREMTAGLVERGLTLHEIDRDLAQLTAAQLQDYLSERGLLPERERIGAAGLR
jgi:protein required for attachment to host cells